MGQDPVAYAVKVKSMGTEQGKSNRSTKADQKNSALKMLQGGRVWQNRPKAGKVAR